MRIPRVIFKPMTLDENIETIKWAFYENNGDLSVHYYTIQYFPELATIDSKIPKEEVYKLIEKIVTKDYEKYKDRINSEVERYNMLWDKYNNIYFQMLSKYRISN